MIRVSGALVAWAVTAVGLLASAPDPLAGQSSADAPHGAVVVEVGSRGGAPIVLTEDGIEVDGRLDDKAWRTATPITEFVQSEPVEGAEPSARTVVRVLFDADAIYIGARLYEPDPSRIARQLVRRGETGQADYFEVMLDPNLDRRTGYLFRVSAAGVQRDAYLFDDTRQDASWEAVWKSEVYVDSLGWSVEMRIPWSQLRYEPGDASQTWGINFARWRVEAGELTYHALIPRNRHGFVSFFRPLPGVSPPAHVRRVELRPYLLGRGRAAPSEPGDPFFSGREADARAGLDMRYGLGTSFTLDATLNPDFGQVEVDPAVINLTAFETFFAERRPFFVEDARIFDFTTSGRGDRLFYSRRIGREPQGRAPGDAAHVDIPDQSTILGAAKLTGRTAGGLSLGALASVTAAEEGRAYRPAGGPGTGEQVGFPAEPRSYHGVVRARHDFRDGASTLGGIVTGIRRDLPGDGSLDFLTSDAYSGGLDFEHTWADREWALAGHVAGSLVRGDSVALIRIQRAPAHYFQRPDARHGVDSTRTALVGADWRLGLARRGGHRWTGSASVSQVTPGFEINDLGYSRTGEQLSTSANISYREIEPGPLLREYRINVSTFQTWRQVHESGSVWIDARWTMNNFWQGFAEVAFRPETMDVTATRGGPLMRSPASRRVVARLNTDRRRPLSFGLGADHQWGAAFSVFEAGVDARWRPAPRFELSVNPELAVRSRADQYVATFADPDFVATYGHRYLFGDLERRTLSMETRLDVTFTRDLTLQLFAQPLLDAGRYTAYKELTAPGSFTFRTFQPGQAADASGDGQVDGCTGGDICFHEGRQLVDVTGDGRVDHTFTDRDFNVVSLRANAVLRWEYRPGSTLFLVWQQRRFERRPFGDFHPGRHPADLLDLAADNVLILKVNYWLGL
jgi:hypothetical protein